MRKSPFKTTGLSFGLNLHKHPNFVYVSNEGSASLRVCADLPETSLLADAINNKIHMLAHKCTNRVSNHERAYLELSFGCI